MAADSDSGSYDGNADTIKISEANTAAADRAYDTDPDTENYASGNDPETAYRNQGRPDGPNGWDSYIHENDDPSNDGDHAQNADEGAEQQEAGVTSQPGDLWGGSDPDAENYADLDSVTGSPGSPDGQDNAQQHNPDTNHDAELNPPDQGASAETSAERSPSPEDERISALQAEIADLRASVEHFVAGTDKSRDGAESTLDQGADDLGNSQDQEQKSPTIAERKGAEQESDTSDAKQAEHSRWRRAISSESLDVLQTLGGTGDAAAALAMHATPEGITGLVLAGIGVAKLAMTKYEHKRKGKA